MCRMRDRVAVAATPGGGCHCAPAAVGNHPSAALSRRCPIARSPSRPIGLTNGSRRAATVAPQRVTFSSQTVHVCHRASARAALARIGSARLRSSSPFHISRIDCGIHADCRHQSCTDGSGERRQETSPRQTSAWHQRPIVAVSATQARGCSDCRVWTLSCTKSSTVTERLPPAPDAR